ncbi:MAG: GGDEF domain-containing protein [Patescibacteria group bacterium]
MPERDQNSVSYRGMYKGSLRVITDLGSNVVDLEAEVAKLRKREEALRKMVEELSVDSVTGLLSKKMFEGYYAKMFAQIARGNHGVMANEQLVFPMALLMIDLDYFKLVNDTHGHLVGDEVLRFVGSAINSLVREADLCGRFGGEELVVVLPKCTTEDAVKIALKIRRRIKQESFEVKTGTFSINVTIGVASWQLGMTRDELIAHADKALYHGKENGRDCVVTWLGSNRFKKES